MGNKNLTTKILESHLVEGELVPGREIGLKIDHTLLQDATGTMAMLEFMAMGVERVKVDHAALYIDHNLLQTDNKNADDHIFLMTAAQKFGVHVSKPGNGVSHQVNLERFGIPGKVLLGADSHTPSAAGLAMIAIGAGGLDVAMAMAGHPFYLPCPKVWGIKLTGELRPWVSAKDVILEMLRRHSSRGCRQNHRILRSRRRHPVSHRPGHHRQHGSRTGGYHHHLPLGPADAEFLDAQERGEV